MLAFDNYYAQVMYYVAATCLAGGLLVFVVQVFRWDREYEDFLIFPLRLAARGVSS